PARVLETAIGARGSRAGLTPLILRLVNFPIRLMASRIGDYERRDSLLAYASAAYLVATLVVWLPLLLVGYALMLWPSSAPFGDALRTAGSSMLTLGIAVPRGSVSTTVVYLA